MKIKKHIPNILSSLRLLSPFVLIPLILSGNLLSCLIALSSFLLTDALDGFLARKWHVQSELGAKIDVVADKMILASLLVPLTIANPMMIITLILEGLISLTNVYRKFKNGKPKTIQLGRIKMVIISLFMFISYLSKIINIPGFIINAIFSITTIFQVVTLSKYIDCSIKEKNDFQDDLKVTNNGNNLNVKYDETKELEKSNNNINKLEKLKNDKKELLKLKEELLGDNIEEIKSKTFVKSLNMSEK